jgi:hypothetical protein
MGGIVGSMRRKWDPRFRRLFKLVVNVNRQQDKISEALRLIGDVLADVDFDNENYLALRETLRITFPPQDANGIDQDGGAFGCRTHCGAPSRSDSRSDRKRYPAFHKMFQLYLQVHKRQQKIQESLGCIHYLVEEMDLDAEDIANVQSTLRNTFGEDKEDQGIAFSSSKPN